MNALLSPIAPAVAVPAFELRNVSKIYGSGASEVRALDGVSFAIAPGEFTAIMGASGSGKSTCMNILGCLDSPTTGMYLFHGVDVGALQADELAMIRRHFIGFVFQGFNLLARTTALENVELPLVYRRMTPRERAERARAALADVGLEGREYHTPAELSGGQQQRVAIARALVSAPSLLLADEPTGNLDTARSREIMALMQGLNERRGLTIVIVTHEQEVADYARRVLLFRDGRILQDRITSAAHPRGVACS